jgi:archaellum component FlaC
MSSLRLKKYNKEEPFDLEILNGSFAFSSDTTDKITMALRISSNNIVNELGEDTSDLGGELLIDSNFLPKIEEFINTSLNENIDNIKNEIKSSMEYVGVLLQDLNVVSEKNELFIEITPVNGETFQVNF